MSVAETAIERVFPRACRVTKQAGDVAPANRFWAIPGRHGPRWVVPQEARLGLPVLKQWRPYGRASRQKWTLLTTAYRAGRLGQMPGVFALGVSGADDADWSHLGWTGGAAPVPVVYVGSAGTARKAVAALVAADSGTVAGVAKVPLDPAAAQTIRREADVLGRLAIERPGLAPRLLYLDPSGEHTVQEFVAGRATGRRLTRKHLRWQAALRDGDETSLRTHVDRVRNRLAALTQADGTTADQVARALDSIDDAAPLTAVQIHGDFAPWNLMRQDDGSLRAIDWELCDPLGLPLQDVFHYLYIQRFLLGSPSDVLGNLIKTPGFPEYLGSTSLDPSMCRPLALFFLASSWVYRNEINDTAHASFLAGEMLALTLRAA